MNTPPPTSTDAARLIWRTRDASRHLLFAFVVSLGIVCASALVLLLSPSHDTVVLAALTVHLMAGTLALLFFAPFLLSHLRDGEEPLRDLLMPWRLLATCRRDPLVRHRLFGHTLMWSLAVVLGSGSVVALPALAYLAGHPLTLPYGAHRQILDVHLWMSAALVVVLLMHFPWKERS
jgi:hypothetical protein